MKNIDTQSVAPRSGLDTAEHRARCSSRAMRMVFALTAATAASAAIASHAQEPAPAATEELVLPAVEPLPEPKPSKYRFYLVDPARPKEKLSLLSAPELIDDTAGWKLIIECSKDLPPQACRADYGSGVLGPQKSGRIVVALETVYEKDVVIGKGTEFVMTITPRFVNMLLPIEDPDLAEEAAAATTDATTDTQAGSTGTDAAAVGDFVEWEDDSDEDSEENEEVPVVADANVGAQAAASEPEATEAEPLEPQPRRNFAEAGAAIRLNHGGAISPVGVHVRGGRYISDERVLSLGASATIFGVDRGLAEADGFRPIDSSKRLGGVMIAGGPEAALTKQWQADQNSEIAVEGGGGFDVMYWSMEGERGVAVSTSDLRQLGDAPSNNAVRLGAHIAGRVRLTMFGIASAHAGLKGLVPFAGVAERAGTRDETVPANLILDAGLGVQF